MSLALTLLPSTLSPVPSIVSAPEQTASALQFLTELDLAELKDATGAHVENGRVLTRSGRPADAATTALFEGIAAAREAEATSGSTSGDLSEYLLLQVKSGAYGTTPDLDPDQVDRLIGEIRSGAYSSRSEGAEAAKHDFLDFMKQSPEERALVAWLKSHNLTLEEFQSLPKDQQQSLLDKFKEDMKKEQEAKYGVGMTVDTST